MSKSKNKLSITADYDRRVTHIIKTVPIFDWGIPLLVEKVRFRRAQLRALESSAPLNHGRIEQVRRFLAEARGQLRRERYLRRKHEHARTTGAIYSPCIFDRS